MCLIHTEPLDTDHPIIRKGYDLFAGKGVAVPLPFRMLSVSPGLFDLMIQRNRYYGSHPRLSFSLLAHIRYFVSARLDFDFCRRHIPANPGFGRYSHPGWPGSVPLSPCLPIPL